VEDDFGLDFGEQALDLVFVDDVACVIWHPILEI
jgi:hypothetical protein